VPGTGGRLATFTGGTGSAAKTVLAASRRAAEQLVDHAGEEMLDRSGEAAELAGGPAGPGRT